MEDQSVQLNGQSVQLEGESVQLNGQSLQLESQSAQSDGQSDQLGKEKSGRQKNVAPYATILSSFSVIQTLILFPSSLDARYIFLCSSGVIRRLNLPEKGFSGSTFFL